MAAELHMSTDGFSRGAPPARLDLAALEFVHSTYANGRSIVDMPVVTGGGNRVAVSVWQDGEAFIVSDDGMAWGEAELSGLSSRVFSTVARERSAAYGAIYDGHTMLFIRVSSDQLRGAIVTMANLVKEVVDETTLRSVNERSSAAERRFTERLVETFGRSRVDLGVELTGDSLASYSVDALVRVDRGYVVFDVFSGHPNSIAALYTKFSDLNRLEEAPGLIGVTRSLERIGPKLNLVSSVSKVIEIDVPRDTLIRLAA